MKISIILFIFLIHCNLLAQDVTLPKTREFQQSLTPDEVINILKEGNSRFINNMRLEREYHTEVKKTSQGQYPWAVLHGCMDSRVTSEIIFDTGIGDIFVNSLAGNIITDEVIGSMEYGCNVVGSKLILVLGHTNCGAVKGAIDDVEFGNITTVLNEIHPAVDSAKFLLSSNIFTSSNSSFVELVTRLNVKMGMDEIRRRSPALKELEDNGKIKIVGAIYDVETGEVKFLE
ncbi:MAG TPA: carbonic anhydrase [Bacteroidetes bacterium]|nr:carbonic anhydrase [Bacteroidota bacterium]HCN37094.1 carbonic anhydrase [Bacteroidota bacterium]